MSSFRGQRLPALAAFVLLSFFGPRATAQYGRPDSSYEHTGVQMLDFGGSRAEPTTILQQPDGKVIAGGHFRYHSLGAYNSLVATRYFSDGRVDSAFGYKGVANFPEATRSGTAVQMLLQTDGKPIFLGTRYYAGAFFDTTILARMTASGQPDSSFGTGGILPLEALVPDFIGTALIHQPDGKLIIGGQQQVGSMVYWSVVRMNTNQTLDSTFGTAGVVRVRVQTNFVYNELLKTLALQPDGKILAGGASNNRTALVRFTASGVVDSSFGLNGRVVAENFQPNVSGAPCTTSSVVIQTDGKIIAGGVGVPPFPNTTFGQFGLIRFTSSGIIDSSYGINGRVVTILSSSRRSEIKNLVIQPDGKLIATGTIGLYIPGTGNGYSSCYAAVRYNSNGTPDPSFANSGILADSFSQYGNVCQWGHLQQDGKLLIISSRTDSPSTARDPFQTARYLANGFPDLSFNHTGKTERLLGPSGSEMIKALFPLADGRILAGGGNHWNSFVVQRNSDGSPDTTFASRGVLELPLKGMCLGMARFHDGRFAIIQRIISDTLTISCFLPTGIPDAGFGSTGVKKLATEFDTYRPLAVTAQPDGKLLLGFTADGHMTVVRLLPNGALDPSFAGTGTKVVHFSNPLRPEEWSSVSTLALQPDGKILVGGSARDYHHFETDEDFAIARLLPNGAPDLSFHNDGVVTTDRTPSSSSPERIYSLGLQSDGKIVSLINGFGLQRFLPNGIPDSSFGTASFILTPLEETGLLHLFELFDQYKLLVQPDDKLLIGAHSRTFVGTQYPERRFAVLRCSAAGVPDSSFGINGIVMPTMMRLRGNSASTLALQIDGKLLIGGYAKGIWDEDFAIVRLTTGLADGGWTNVPLTKSARALNASLYPNPAAGAFTLSFELRQSSPTVLIALRDLRGRIVHRESLNNLSAGPANIRMELPERAASGLYFVTVEAAEGSSTLSLIKQ